MIILLSVLVLVVIIVAGVYLFIQQPPFGKVDTRQERIQQSPNFKNGKFQNLSHTPDLAEGVSYYRVMKEFFFGKSKRNLPDVLFPTQKTDLFALPPGENVIVWFGHSSYFMQVDGKKILADPVLSGSASPVKFTTRSFKGSDVYTADDIPEIDYLFISHDHWDHLDYETMIKLKPKIKKVVTGMGTGLHLERWGFEKSRIVEKDWWEHAVLEPGFEVHFCPARHFSGRGLKRNQSLWSSFVLKTPTMKIYLGGDSGYDSHFAAIGERFGRIDLAILECGQYHEYWKYIHMMPEEVVQAAIDLKAQTLFPVHWAKFSLALHDWDDSIIRATKEAERKNQPVIHPMIGEKVNLRAPGASAAWWKMAQKA